MATAQHLPFRRQVSLEGMTVLSPMATPMASPATVIAAPPPGVVPPLVLTPSPLSSRTDQDADVGGGLTAQAQLEVQQKKQILRRSTMSFGDKVLTSPTFGIQAEDDADSGGGISAQTQLPVPQKKILRRSSMSNVGDFATPPPLRSQVELGSQVENDADVTGVVRVQSPVQPQVPQTRVLRRSSMSNVGDVEGDAGGRITLQPHQVQPQPLQQPQQHVVEQHHVLFQHAATSSAIAAPPHHGKRFLTRNTTQLLALPANTVPMTPHLTQPQPAAAGRGESMAPRRSFTTSRTLKLSGMLVQQLLPDTERPQEEEEENENNGTFQPPSMDDDDDDEDEDVEVGSATSGSASSAKSSVGDGTSGGSPGTSHKRMSGTSSVVSRRPSHLESPVKRFATGLLPRLEMKMRLMDRDASFGQSLGHWHIKHFTKKLGGILRELNALYAEDWYHTFLDAKFRVQMTAFALMFFLCFCVFALIYLAISGPCGLNLHGNFIKAYLLSLETMMTIGYGVPDPYMKGCWQAPIVLTVQVLIQVLMTALLVGVVFQGISRPQARACTIVFSENAVIREVNGAFYLMFRVCDLRTRHSLIEAHVRCYCVRRHPIRGHEMVQMRLEHPDDELGGALQMTLPTMVVHRIDAWSPLAPPPKVRAPARAPWEDAAAEAAPNGPDSASCPASPKTSRPAAKPREHFRRAHWPSVPQRQVDGESGNRDSCVCPTCGETFGDLHSLRLHCSYNARMDEASGLPVEHRHYELQEEDIRNFAHASPSREDIELFLAHNYREVLVLVEGIEPTTSSTLQARHSYVVGGLRGEDQDVVWDKEFADCTAVPSDGRGLGLDLGRFHLLVDPPSRFAQSRADW